MTPSDELRQMISELDRLVEAAVRRTRHTARRTDAEIQDNREHLAKVVGQRDGLRRALRVVERGER